MNWIRQNSRSPRGRLQPVIRLLAALALSKALLGPATACAAEIAAGFAAVEEGDDRVRPALATHLGFGDFWQGRLYYYGREFGPVREETGVVSFARRWGLFRSNTVSASFGGVLMDERVTIEYERAEDEEHNENEDSYNLGAVFGIGWSLPKSTGPLYMTVSWDSHVFPAGMGGLFLATGRKQMISCIFGVRL